MTSTGGTMKKPESGYLTNFRSLANPHGLRFVEGDPAPNGSAGGADEAQGEKKDNGRAGGNDQIMADLQGEREKRKALEQTVADLKKSHTEQTAALATALGVKVDTKKDGDDIVAALQKQVSEMQRDAAVNRIAREHQITDTDDIALIGEARNEEAMTKVAARLVASASPGTPKPDLSQGPKDAAPKPDPGPGVARLAAAFEDELSK